MKSFFTLVCSYLLTPFLLAMYWYTNHFGFIFVYDMLLLVLSVLMFFISGILFLVRDQISALNNSSQLALDQLKKINEQPWWKTYITYVYWIVPFMYLVYLEFYGSTVLLLMYVCGALILKAVIKMVVVKITENESSKS